LSSKCHPLPAKTFKVQEETRLPSPAPTPTDAFSKEINPEPPAWPLS
jgi:hypothetical protein